MAKTRSEALSSSTSRRKMSTPVPELASKFNSELFDKVKLLAKHWGTDPVSNPAYQEVIDFFNRACFLASVTDFIEMLKMFPKRKQWETGNLYEMQRAAIQPYLDAERLRRKQRKPQRRSVPLTEYQQLQQKYDLALDDVKQLKSYNKTLRLIIDALYARFGVEPSEPSEKTVRQIRGKRVIKFPGAGTDKPAKN